MSTDPHLGREPTSHAFQGNRIAELRRRAPAKTLAKTNTGDDKPDRQAYDHPLQRMQFSNDLCRKTVMSEGGVEQLGDIESDSSSGSTTGCFPFMKLPLELRCEVYKYLPELKMQPVASPEHGVFYQRVDLSPSILQTCKQVNEEVRELMHIYFSLEPVLYINIETFRDGRRDFDTGIFMMRDYSVVLLDEAISYAKILPKNGAQALSAKGMAFPVNNTIRKFLKARLLTPDDDALTNLRTYLSVMLERRRLHEETGFECRILINDKKLYSQSPDVTQELQSYHGFFKESLRGFNMNSDFPFQVRGKVNSRGWNGSSSSGSYTTTFVCGPKPEHQGAFAAFTEAFDMTGIFTHIEGYHATEEESSLF